MKIKCHTWPLPCRFYILPYLLIVFLFLFLSQATLAAENIQQDIQADIPLSTAINLERAQKLIQADENLQALALLEEFKGELMEKDQPIHPFLLFTLGNLYMDEGQTEKAALNYEACIEQESGADFSSVWLNLAKANYELERFERAGDCFIRGYGLEKEKRGVLLYYAANAFFSANKYALALDAFTRLTTDHPDEVELRWHEIAVHTLMALELPKKALPHMELLAENLEGKPRTRWQETLLYHYMTLGMDQKALQYVSRLTKEYPLEPKWWRGVARLSLDKDNLAKALSAMTIYSFLTPLTDEEKRLVADLYLSVGIPSRAVDVYEQIPAGEKRLETVKNTIAALQQMNLDEKALELLNGVLNTNKSSNESKKLELKTLKGNLLFSLGRFEESVEIFKTLTTKDKSGRSWLMLGYSLWNLGEIKSAQEAMARAATFKHQKKAANRALKSLSSQN